MAYDYRNKCKRKLFREKKLEECEGCCEICGKSTFLVVDHNKTTGKMRGLLCFRHNSGLGIFKDNPLELEEAAKYLRRTGSASYSIEEPQFLPRPLQKNLDKEQYEKGLLELLNTGACSNFTDLAKVHIEKTGCSISAAKTFISRAAAKHGVTAKRQNYKGLL